MNSLSCARARVRRCPEISRARARGREGFLVSVFWTLAAPALSSGNGDISSERETGGEERGERSPAPSFLDDSFALSRLVSGVIASASGYFGEEKRFPDDDSIGRGDLNLNVESRTDRSFERLNVSSCARVYVISRNKNAIERYS